MTADCDCDWCAPLQVEMHQDLGPVDSIYLDHAATTPLDPVVFERMRPYLCEQFGNPSSLHRFGRQARAAVEIAREQVARCLGAEPEEIYFTSGGTESDNMALQGVIAANGGRRHIATSAIEHHAVLDTCKHLGCWGVRATWVPVDGHGVVDPDDVRRAITNETALVSIMHANNEIGTIQPIAAISRICAEAGVLFHSDAVQSVGSLPVGVEELGVDFLSLSGHKLYGPKGAGALYARRGTRWTRFIHGGAQERHGRAGTENVAGIVGLGAALERAEAMRNFEAQRLTALRERLVERVLAQVDRCWLNGHPTRRLPNNVSFSLEGVAGEALLMHLDLLEIAASNGSACISGSLEPSHVLKAIGTPPAALRGSIRFSLGRSTTLEQVDYVADTFAQVVAGLRNL